MSWGVDEKGEPRGLSPAQNTEGLLQSGLRGSGPLGTASCPGKTGRHAADLQRDGRPRPACDQTGSGDLRRPQVPLRTVFNICKTATRAAKVNSVPGSSKVSEFKCFPFACKESARACGRAAPGRPPAPPAPGICAHRGCVSHTNTQNFSLKLMTVSTAQAGLLIWKSHFATRPTPRRPTPGKRGHAVPLPARRSGNRGTGADDMRHLAGRSGEARAGQALSPASQPAVAGLGVGEEDTEQHCPAVPPAGSPAPWGAFPLLQGKTPLSPACATVPGAGCWGKHQRWEHKALQASCQEGVKAPAGGRRCEERGSEKEERVNSSPSRFTHADPR